MLLSKEGQLLRIFIGESYRHDGSPLYEAIVIKARSLNLSGATVLRGIMGYGAHSQLHTTKILRLSEDMPIIIEIVDTSDNIHKLLPFLDEVVGEGLITLENIRIIKYRQKPQLT